jgi:hypothetical protein
METRAAEERKMNSILKKGLICGLAALTLGLAVVETTSPAMAWGRGGWHGGYGWGGRGYGWGLGALAGGLALGAVAAGAYGYPGYGYGYGYGYPAYGYGGCWQQRPVYDAYGYFRGYRPVAVC